MLLFFSGKTKKVFSGSQFNSAQSEYFLSLIDEANVMLIFLLAKQKTRSVARHNRPVGIYKLLVKGTVMVGNSNCYRV